MLAQKTIGASPEGEAPSCKEQEGGGTLIHFSPLTG
jgi:hypothetical protein